MKIGILSDTHNDNQTLRTILQHFREEHISTILHCGDLTSPEMVRLFDGFTLHLAFGNGDYLTGGIRDQVILLGSDSTAQRLNTLFIFEKKVLVVHGNFGKELDKLVKDRIFDFVFTGHTHLRANTMTGNTRVINPGAANRLGDPPYSYATYDFQQNILNFYQAQC